MSVAIAAFPSVRRVLSAIAFTMVTASACAAQGDGVGDVAPTVTALAPPVCDGVLAQGGLATCLTVPGATLAFGGEPVALADGDGWATLGFARAAPASLELTASFEGQRSDVVILTIADRDFPATEVGGLDCDYVSPPRTPEVQSAIERAWILKRDTWREFADGQGARAGFSAPGEGTQTSPYGSSRRKYGDGCERTSIHWGLDLRAPTGSDVLAPAAGVVALADDLYFEGGAVFIDHGHGLISVFMHMSSIDVAPGDVVAAGDRLGGAGMTGTANGPHIHWGLKWRNVFNADGTSGAFYVDPTLALQLAPVQSGAQSEAQ